MTAERALSSRTTPALVVRTQGSDRSLQAGPSYRIGRDPESDIVVNDSRVSWQHAVLRFDQHDQNGWILQDAGSTNGTFLGSQRVSQITISNDCVLRLGHPDDGPAVTLLADRPRPARRAFRRSGRRLAAGRLGGASGGGPARRAGRPHSAGRARVPA